MFTRPNWNDYFIGIAWAVAERSDCRRSKVGAVLVDGNHRIISTGYVGVSPGQPGCLDGACPRGLLSPTQMAPYTDYSNCISTHAEQNCIDYALDWFDLAELITWDLSMYITREPCKNCFHYVLDRGVSRLVWDEKDHGEYQRFLK